MLTKIVINGVDVSSKCVSWQYEVTYGSLLSEITVNFINTVTSLISFQTGYTMQVYRGYASPTEQKVFDGYIEKFEPQNGIITVTGIDKLWDAVRKQINVVYDSSLSVTAGKISAIFQDIVNRYVSSFNASGTNTSVASGKLVDSTASFTTDGINVGDNVWNETLNTWAKVSSVDSNTQISLSNDIFTATGQVYLIKPSSSLYADNVSVQDSGNTMILQKFICANKDPFDRLQTLMNALNWQFYYLSSDNRVYFEPKGFKGNSTVLTVGVNVLKIPHWQYDITEMANNVLVKGASQLVETSVTGQIGVTPGFTNYSIQLSNTPVSIKCFQGSSNPPTNLKVGGIVQSTQTFDYSVDTTRNQVLPAPGTTFATNDYWQVNYSYYTPIPVNVYNQDSMNTYGVFAKTISFNDIVSVADAITRGNQYLSEYSTPFIYTTLQIKDVINTGIWVGQNITVVDNISKPSVNDVLTINTIRLRYPTDYDELDVGDKYWRLSVFSADVLANFQSINNKELSETSIVNDLINVDNTISNPLKITNRYFKIQTQTFTGNNVFVLGNTGFGVLGQNALGGAGWGSIVDYFVSQGGNVYIETFYDSDFKDAVNTTASWSNGLNFNAYQTAQSVSIDYNNGVITTCLLTATVSSGSFNFSLSADGGVNWETVTNGVLHNFTHTGTDLRFKIVEAAGSTGSISKIVLSNYH